MRYNLFGYAVSEQKDDNATLDPSAQVVTQATVVYTTDAIDEVKTIVRNGGYIDGSGQWMAVQWAEDSITNGIMGDKPQTANAYKKTARQALRKEDF